MLANSTGSIIRVCYIKETASILYHNNLFYTNELLITTAFKGNGSSSLVEQNEFKWMKTIVYNTIYENIFSMKDELTTLDELSSSKHIYKEIKSQDLSS